MIKSANKIYLARLLLAANLLLTHSLGWLPVQVQASESTPPLHHFRIPQELMIELSKLPPNDFTLELNIEGYPITGVYLGLRDRSTGLIPCSNLSNDCIPHVEFFESSGSVGVKQGEYVIREAGSQDGHTGILNMQKGSFGGQMIGGLNRAAAAGVQGAVLSGLTGALGGKPLFEANQKYLRAVREYRDAEIEYRANLGHLNLVRASLRELNIHLADINQAGDSSLIGAQIPQFHSAPFIDMGLFEKTVVGFDDEYQIKAKAIAQKINQAPRASSQIKNDVRTLSRNTLINSVESRIENDIELSDAQLKLAETFADIFLGIDPITGVARGFIEAYTGVNLVTGESLSDFERSLTGAFGALNLVTLGVAASTVTTVKVLNSIFKAKFNGNLTRFFKLSKMSEKIVELVQSKHIFKHHDVQMAQGILKTGYKGKKVTNLEEADTVLDLAVADSLLQPLRFSKSFVDTPYSQESLEYISHAVKLGALKAEKIYPGNTHEIYIIGRRMGGAGSPEPGVINYAEELVKHGYNQKQIRIFDPWDKTHVNLASYTQDLRDLMKLKNRRLHLSELEETAVWTYNKKWAEQMIGTASKRPTIIKLSRNPADGHSHFYDDLELILLEKSRRLPWNP